MSTVGGLEQPIDPLSDAPPEGWVAGRSPWALAGHKLVRNRLAMAALAMFLGIVVVSFMGPFYADHVAHTDPFTSQLTATTVINGKKVDVLQQGGGVLKLGETPIGPTWQRNYFLGADSQGRDVAARVLYGGRTSLTIGIGSAVICSLLAVIVGMLAGFYGGVTDSIISRGLDVVWAFPVYLLAISIATVLLTQGLKIGPVSVSASSLWLPTLIIAVIYVPYVARPVRGAVLSVREKEFIEAAIAQGAGDYLVNHFVLGDGVRHYLLGSLAKIQLALDKELQPGEIRVHVTAYVLGGHGRWTHRRQGLLERDLGFGPGPDRAPPRPLVRTA
jgi:peptide/nickel transport system permease protein